MVNGRDMGLCTFWHDNRICDTRHKNGHDLRKRNVDIEDCGFGTEFLEVELQCLQNV